MDLEYVPYWLKQTCNCAIPTYFRHRMSDKKWYGSPDNIYEKW